MSGPEFEGVLAAHVDMPCSEHTPTVNAWWAQCEGCDWKGPRRSNRASREHDHRAHLSAALHAELARWLGDEGTRDRVLDHVCPRASGPCPDCCETVPAALAALTTTDQEMKP